jgi:phenylalanyl-tRNA synthetase beta chain
VANPTIELFEIAKTYLPKAGSLPGEEVMLGLTSGGDFFAVKGAIEAIFEALAVRGEMEVRNFQHSLLTTGSAAEVLLDGVRVGVLGEVSWAALTAFDLRGATTVAELRLAPLIERAELVPRYKEIPSTPAIARDLNLELKEDVRWAEIATAIKEAGGGVLEQLAFKDIYRDEELRGRGEKRLLFSVTLRDPQTTLTGAEADAIRDRIVAACSERYGARLQAS